MSFPWLLFPWTWVIVHYIQFACLWVTVHPWNCNRDIILLFPICNNSAFAVIGPTKATISPWTPLPVAGPNFRGLPHYITLCENSSGSPLPCGDEPLRYLTYPPNVVACAFVIHVTPHPSDTHGSRSVGPHLSSVMTSVADTIVVLVASMLEEAAVGPNCWATEEKRGCLVQ